MLEKLQYIHERQATSHPMSCIDDSPQPHVSVLCPNTTQYPLVDNLTSFYCGATDENGLVILVASIRDFKVIDQDIAPCWIVYRFGNFMGFYSASGSSSILLTFL